MKPQTKAVSLVLLFSLFLSVFAFSGVASASGQEQVQFASPIVVVNTSFLNVRSGPAVGYSIIATVVGGTELPVLAIARDRVWYQVATDVGPGWVNVTFTLPRGDFSHVPIVSPGDTAVQTVAALGQGGGGGGNVTGRLWGVSVLGGDFHVAPDDQSDRIAIAQGEDLNNVYPLLGQTVIDGRPWDQIEIPGLGVGWKEAHFLVIRPRQCDANQTVVVLLRSGYLNGTSSPVQIQAGNEAYVTDVRDQQIQIELIDGSRGWLRFDEVVQRSDSVSSFCDDVLGGMTGMGTTTDGTAAGSTIAPPVVSGPRVVINTGNLNVRSGPGAGYSVVATFAGGTTLSVIGIARDHVWFWVEGTFGRGWVNSQYTLFRGDISTVPVVDFRTVGAG